MLILIESQMGYLQVWLQLLEEVVGAIEQALHREATLNSNPPMATTVAIDPRLKTTNINSNNKTTKPARWVRSPPLPKQVLQPSEASTTRNSKEKEKLRSLPSVLEGRRVPNKTRKRKKKGRLLAKWPSKKESETPEIMKLIGD